MMVAVMVFSILNVPHVKLPAISVTIRVYVQFPVIVAPSVIHEPLSVAVTPERLSSNVIVISVSYVLPLVKPEYVGGILSIRVTLSMREK
jgi:hypothetical protein